MIFSSIRGGGFRLYSRGFNRRVLSSFIQSLRNPVSEKIWVGWRNIWRETGFLVIMQSLRNPVSQKIWVGGKSISEETGFLGIIHHVKKPDFLYQFQKIMQLIAFSRRRIGKTQPSC